MFHRPFGLPARDPPVFTHPIVTLTILALAVIVFGSVALFGVFALAKLI